MKRRQYALARVTFCTMLSQRSQSLLAQCDAPLCGHTIGQVKRKISIAEFRQVQIILSALPCPLHRAVQVDTLIL